MKDLHYFLSSLFTTISLSISILSLTSVSSFFIGISNHNNEQQRTLVHEIQKSHNTHHNLMNKSFLRLYNKDDDDDDDDDEIDDDDDDEDDDIRLSSKRSVTSATSASNVLGTELYPCCTNVRNTGIGTGFYRNGYCSTGEQDIGRHTVCVQVTDEFLQYSKSVGNDLSTPAPQYMFPGLQNNDIWCLCAQRWVQAYQADAAPKVFLKSTHEKTLSYIPYDILRQYAIDQKDADQTKQQLDNVREQLKKLL